MTHTILSFIKPVLVTGLIIAGFAGAMMMAMPRVDSYLKLKAFDDCAKAATYTYETKSTASKDGDIMSSSVEPMRQFYKTCITDKGYTTKLEEK